VTYYLFKGLKSTLCITSERIPESSLWCYFIVEFEMRRSVSINALQVIAMGTPKRNDYFFQKDHRLFLIISSQYTRIVIIFY